MRRASVSLLVLAVLLVPALAPATVSEEQALGRRFALEAAGQLPTLTDPAVLGLVRDMGERLVDTLGPQPFDYTFQVVAHPSLNAFAVPGGYIWIFSGLIARVSSLDELASVVGHEIAHAHAHHVVRQQQETRLINYASLLGMLLSAVHPVAGAAGVAAAQAAGLKYNREFEEEADYLGLRFMQAAGYEPSAMPEFFKKILAEQRLNPTGVPPYLLTHPLTEDRITKVETSLATFERSGRKTAAGDATAADGQRALAEARAVIEAETGDTELIVGEYRRRAEAAPDDAFAQYLLGIVYTSVLRFDAAVVALERARSLGERSSRLAPRLAYVYLRQGRPKDAKAELEPYLAKHGRDAVAREMMGQTLLELGDKDAGIAELERSIVLDPTRPESHRLLGQEYGRTGRPGAAFLHLGKSYELRGRLVEAYSHYVRAREALGEEDPRVAQVDASIKELEEVVGARKLNRR
jgi:predicted Zn-dependent protease